MREQSIYLALLVLISAVNSVSQVLMRWGGLQSAQNTASIPTVWHWMWASRWWLSGIAVGWIAGLGWAWCLRKLSLGLAIPLYAGLVYVLSVVCGAWFLKEKMSTLQVLGIIVILVGIVLVTLSAAPPRAAALEVNASPNAPVPQSIHTSVSAPRRIPMKNDENRH